MKKIAFFVEGLTEQLFISKLLSEVITTKNLSINKGRISGGGRRMSSISIETIEAEDVTADTKWYVLIYDCGGDENVRSYIDENRNNLFKEGYTKIIGIRDIYPIQMQDSHSLEYGLYYRTPQEPIQTKYILPKMEIEGWFLSECNHFKNIDASITLEEISTNLQFNPETDDMELRHQPAKDLHECYRLAGLSYLQQNRKTKRKIERTIEAIDYCNVYFNLKDVIPSLSPLIDEIDDFFK